MKGDDRDEYGTCLSLKVGSEADGRGGKDL